MFDLNGYLEQQRRRVDVQLDASLPAENEPPIGLSKSMRYAVFTGGKRLRPVLCLAAADAVGGESESALAAAMAVELLHTYTLVHDDLPCMDDDDMRRGKPSCHRAFDIATAVLAGDALQSLAFEILAGAPAPAELVRELARAAGSRGVAGGQSDDLAEHAGAPDAQTIDSIHQRKTASLFSATLRMGAISVRAQDHDVDSLGHYGTELGLAFQITDDLLGHADGEEDELTCLAVYDAAAAARKAREHIDRAVAHLTSLDPTRTEPLHAIASTIAERTS